LQDAVRAIVEIDVTHYVGQQSFAKIWISVAHIMLRVLSFYTTTIMN
jgi:hypothetical protein